MAIFTNKADALLPALTQFYQVTVWPRDAGETDLAYGRRLLSGFAGEELRAWVARVAYLSESEIQAKLSNPLGGHPKPKKEFMVWMADLHSFLCKLMSCAADDCQPDRYQVRRLNELLVKYAPPQIAWYSALKVDGQLETRIEKDDVDFFYPNLEVMSPFVGTIESLESFTGRLLMREFYQALTRRQFARCAVCESVFWKENPKALQCSQRCSNRQSQRALRRRRQTKTRNGQELA